MINSWFENWGKVIIFDKSSLATSLEIFYETEIWFCFWLYMLLYQEVIDQVAVNLASLSKQIFISLKKTAKQKLPVTKKWLCCCVPASYTGDNKLKPLCISKCLKCVNMNSQPVMYLNDMLYFCPLLWKWVCVISNTPSVF